MVDTKKKLKQPPFCKDYTRFRKQNKGETIKHSELKPTIQMPYRKPRVQKPEKPWRNYELKRLKQWPINQNNKFTN